MRRAAALLPWAIVGVGVGLRLREYCLNRSLWWDEAALALNVIQRGYLDLLRPLDYNQAAPYAVLVASRALVQAAGSSEFVLRSLPLLFAIASLLLFCLLARRILSPRAAAIAVGLFAVSEPLIQYATEFKQYAVDVAVSVAITHGTLVMLERYRQGRPLRLLSALSAVGGALAVWISHPSAFVLLAAACAIAYECARARRWSHLTVLGLVSGMWLLSFGGSYALYLREAANQYLRDFWSARVPYEGVPIGGAFLPVPTSPGELRQLVRWTLQSGFALFANPGGIHFQGAACLAFLIGAATFLKSRTAEALLLLLPFAVAVLASAAEAYPFCCRVLLFLTPPLILTIAHGADVLMEALAPISRVGAWAMVVLLFLFPHMPLRSFTNPIVRVELRPALDYVVERRAGDDLLYLAYGTGPVARYYVPRYGLPEESVVLGAGSVFEPSSADKTRRIAEDVGQLAGRNRVWVILAYIPPAERDAIVARLTEIGIVRQTYQTRDVEVYEFRG